MDDYTFPAPQSATDVNVTVSATGNTVLPVNQGAFVQSVGTGGTAAYSVATVSGEAGSVTLAIAAGGYSIGSPSSAVVSVLRFLLYMVGCSGRPSVHGRPSDGGGHCGR